MITATLQQPLEGPVFRREATPPWIVIATSRQLGLFKEGGGRGPGFFLCMVGFVIRVLFGGSVFAYHHGVSGITRTYDG